jgi:hypothetical protein
MGYGSTKRVGVELLYDYEHRFIGRPPKEPSII